MIVIAILIHSIEVDSDEDSMNKNKDYFLVENNNTENTLFKISIVYLIKSMNSLNLRHHL